MFTQQGSGGASLQPNYYEIMTARRMPTRDSVVGLAHHRAVTDPTKKQSVHSGAWHELVGVA